MEFNAGAAIIAGLIGGSIMAMLLYMGIAMMPNQMRMNLFLMLGTMMIFRGGPMAYVAGAMIHAVMSIVFALIHVAVYRGFLHIPQNSIFQQVWFALKKSWRTKRLSEKP